MKRVWLFFALFVISQQVFSQSVIYRKNGEVISVYNLEVEGKNWSYNLPGDAAGVKRFISISTIDSIRHEDGSVDVLYNSGLNYKAQEEEEQSFNRLFLGTDVAAILFYKTLKVSLEYLPGSGVVGFYAAYSYNSDPYRLIYYIDNPDNHIYFNAIRIMKWNGRAGINVYFFPPGIFRISSGFHWITGKYTEEMVEYLDEEPFIFPLEKTDKSLSGVILSPGLNWQPKSFLRITAAVDIALFMNSEVKNDLILRTEVSFNF